MYEQFFGLRERPFDLTPNPRFLVMTDGHREALSNLEYAIASRKGVTLLLGEAGSGKTTVIRAAVAQQTSRVHCVHLHNPALTRNEFVEMLAARFELSDDARRSKTALLLEMEALLQKRYETQGSDSPHRGRSAEPVHRTSRRDSSCSPTSKRRRKAVDAGHCRSARARDEARRFVAASVEAAHRASM
jgi:energy-coupling factor transporter ATP-binding protein EcfA2